MECNIVDGKNISTLITEEMISEIIKLLIVFDIRGFLSDEYLNEQIDSIFDHPSLKIYDMNLEPEDRMHPIETTVRECFRHQSYCIFAMTFKRQIRVRNC